MEELAARIVTEHVQQLSNAATQKVQSDGLTPEELTGFLDRLRTLGLVVCGKVRARWLLDGSAYCRATLDHHRLVADLLLAVAMMARVSGTEPVIVEDSVIEFRRDNRVVAACLLASGKGHRGRPSMEAAVDQQRRRYRARAVPVTGAIVGGTSDWAAVVSPPVDVVRGNMADDIVVAHAPLPLHHIAELRANPDRIQEVVR
jgi:hypothetical protein